MDKKIVALFDFCDTLFDGQSINLFLDYLYKKESNWLIKFQLKASKFFSSSPKDDELSLKHKNFLFAPLIGKDKKIMENIAFEFNREILLKKEHKGVVKRLLWHQESGHTIVILSGGFDMYLQYYVLNYNIDIMISTELKFDAGKFIGIEEQCLGAKKIERLKKVLTFEDYDWKHSYAYSDSKSDIPLLNLTGNSFVVYNNQDISWKKSEWSVINVSE